VFIELLGEELGACVFTVSRLDLYVDVQGWCPTGDDRYRFVCRGQTLETYEAGGELTGFSFGRRKTGTIVARIYDKTRDADRKGADFWGDVWGDRLDPAMPVIRVEFELARTALREYGLDTLGEVLNAVPALWSSVTSDWLTYRSPTATRHAPAGRSPRSGWRCNAQDLPREPLASGACTTGGREEASERSFDP
jgi:hypothetical protein